MNEAQNLDWLDHVVSQVMIDRPEGKLIVSSGHSPSGTYHVGTLREIMTANAIAWALRRAGREAEHWDIVDDYDALRKLPAGLPESWKRYIGVPLAYVPDPTDCHVSYGAHYLQQLNDGLAAVGATPDKQLSGFENYQSGQLTDQIILALDKLELVRSTITEVSKRELDEHWSPVQIADDEHNLRNRMYTGWNSATRMVSWLDRDGPTGEVSIDKGQVKLDWRLDWPARWAKWGIGVEPFGRDHATKGGSYDTGRVLVERIFGGKAPYPVPYEFINSVGDTKKMSKSAGNVLTPQAALEIMPPEILRYFIIKPRPSRTLNFDSGLGLYNLIDEYSKAQADAPSTAMAYAQDGSADLISHVPFNHLVAVYQAALSQPSEVREILLRTGYETAVHQQWPVIERELVFVKNWLATYAPVSVKFEVQAQLPVVELTDTQRTFLAKLAKIIQTEKDLNGQGMHDAIYAASEVAKVTPSLAFVALYKVILGQESGPKAGWFLASLQTDWVVSRLLAGSTLVEKTHSEVAQQPVTLPDGRKFEVAAEILANFPHAAVGYLVADITVSEVGSDWTEAMASNLADRKISKDSLSTLPEIAGWREAYRAFGVKASDYRCSVEALVRRALDDNYAQVNSIVDSYNYVSLKHLLPMGAMDLDKVHGDITLRYGHEGETAHLLGIDKPVIVTPRQVVYADAEQIITWLWNYRDARDTAVSLTTRRAIFFVDGLTGIEAVQSAVADLANVLSESPGCKVLAQGSVASQSA